MDASAGLISLAYYNYFMRSFTAPELANLVDPTITIDLIALQNFLNAIPL